MIDIKQKLVEVFGDALERYSNRNAIGDIDSDDDYKWDDSHCDHWDPSDYDYYIYCDGRSYSCAECKGLQWCNFV